MSRASVMDDHLCKIKTDTLEMLEMLEILDRVHHGQHLLLGGAVPMFVVHEHLTGIHNHLLSRRPDMSATATATQQGQIPKSLWNVPGALQRPNGIT